MANHPFGERGAEWVRARAFITLAGTGVDTELCQLKHRETENKAKENCPSRLLRPCTIDHIQLWIRITVQYKGGRTLKMLQRSPGLPHPPKDQGAGHSTSVSKGGAETHCSYEGTAAWHSHRQFIINECDWLCSNRSLWSLKYEYQIILTYKIYFFWFFLTS